MQKFTIDAGAQDADFRILTGILNSTHYHIIDILAVAVKYDRDRSARNVVQVRRGRKVAARSPFNHSLSFLSRLETYLEDPDVR